MKMLPLVAALAFAAVAMPAAAQSRSGHEALPPEQDPTQTPEELAQTRSLNADVLNRIVTVDQHNAAAAESNAAGQANAELDAEAAARAEANYEADRANYEAQVRASAAAEAQYEADMAVWRERVRACESGVRAACSPN